ncbi:MAG: nucleoside triphosphate pyrophosphohydrolase family protein [Allomuricauda sp.]
MYKEAESLNMVAEFHASFKHPIKNCPGIPTSDRTELRVKLISEELDELKEGIRKKDIVEIADALCDIQYVLSGAVLEFGLAEKFNELFNEVQRSNMSKACKNEGEAINSVEYYKNTGVDCYYEKKGDLYILYRSEDHKVMKSIYYSEARLKDILEKS